MQLDVDVSPPANIMTFRLTLANMTFEPKSTEPYANYNTFQDMDSFLGRFLV